ncbi:type VI secretion system-associated protein TagF [Trinickia fusca]|uniref:Type VI secretion system-associated protein TagF n=2 Tax=Trinickia fusca TaxID=2419777 RepID=A0A494X4N8_9BURK|nr:type VI secretion system-associated protein TagF [Trinickia fusca]
MPRALAQAWEQWFALGMAELHEARREAFVQAYLQAPVWDFAMPAGADAGWVQFGCLAPSRDRVGRHYPLVVADAMTAADYSPRSGGLAGARLGPMREALTEAIERAHGPEQFDSVLAEQVALGHAPSAAPPVPGWPNLLEYFDPHGTTSFWWTREAGSAPARTEVHTGRLDGALFRRLFGERAQQRFE